MSGADAAASERSRLDEVAGRANYPLGANGAMIEYTARIFRRHLNTAASCLELGPAEGTMTRLLSGEFEDLTCVEGSSEFCRELRRRFPRVEVVESLFEDFQPTRRYDNVVLSHVLEHVENPVAILRRVRDWLTDDGTLIASVPNALSIHRQMAVIMGLLQDEHELNDTDRRIGHRRVYDTTGFHADMKAGGFAIRMHGGYWMKPVSNAQIEASWSPQMLEAAMVMGERCPELAAEIYVVACKA